ncbi:Ger(x)C family spore germination protein [Dethiobacter alkaliphilus]|uniref:Ger(x)C family spore germination protein n=1 Tax=Dethiobacter alkaliphilus TaxID=427926 RepID=UPI0022263B03|nr:Ger(x)C family spore germination protein [Dethiobacter alkaliphilus]MCW3490122.1 Ger(x)C family spore germination protein [Dethiobacter alkaliphilus]
MRKCWLIPILLILLTSGCWDVQDIRNRSFVTAIGIDATQDADGPKYKITFEVVRPAGVRPDAQTPASIIHTLEADSIKMAIELLHARIGRPVTLAHLTVILIGEEKAKEEDFRHIADFFLRHPEVQKRVRVMFVHQTEAMELLKTTPTYEPYLSAHLITLAQLDHQQSIVRTNPFIEFLLDLRKTNGKGLASRILAAEGDIPIRHGAAVFNRWKLNGWLSNSETQAANWIVGEINATVEGKKADSVYTYFVEQKSVRLVPHINGDKISFTVKLHTDGTILQQQGEPFDLSDPAETAQLESLLSQTIKKQVEGAIAKAQQEFAIDYLGFGMALNRRHPDIYQDVDWDTIFPSVPINVEVNSVVTRTGLSP